MLSGRFGRFWLAATISSFGTAVSSVALPVLLVQVLGASATEVGLVNAAQFVPYAVLGLVAGVFVDRWRRKPVLVVSSLGRALCLAGVPALWLAGRLGTWSLAVLLMGFGAFSVFGFAASQSILPTLVERAALVRANARLDQSDTAAQTVGPLVGGGLVGVLGAPIAIAIDAASYVVEACLTAGLRVEERPAEPTERPRLLAQVKEGLGWTYQHVSLGPLAVSTHVWFLASSASGTVLSLLALRTLGLSPLAFSLLVACGGVTGLVGASIAPAVGRWLGPGPTIVGARLLYAVTWLIVAVALGTPAATWALFVSLALHGLAAGVENSNEMGYWQALTPDGLLGRVNATRRSMNRTVAVLGSVLGGVCLAQFGDRATLLGIVAAFSAATAVVAFSPLRLQGRSWRPEPATDA